MAELSLTVKLHYANDDAPSMKSFSLENVRHDASALDLLVTQSATVARRERVGELRWRWGPKMEAMYRNLQPKLRAAVSRQDSDEEFKEIMTCLGISHIELDEAGPEQIQQAPEKLVPRKRRKIASSTEQEEIPLPTPVVPSEPPPTVVLPDPPILIGPGIPPMSTPPVMTPPTPVSALPKMTTQSANGTTSRSKARIVPPLPDKVQAQMAALQSSFQLLYADQDSMRTELQQAQYDVQRLSDAAEEAKAELARNKEAAAPRLEELEQCQDEMRSAQAKLTEERKISDDLKAQLTTAQSELDDLRSQLDNRDKELETMNHARMAAVTACAGAEKKLQDVENCARTDKEQVQRFQKHSAELLSRASAVKKEMEIMQQEHKRSYCQLAEFLMLSRKRLHEELRQTTNLRAELESLQNLRAEDQRNAQGENEKSRLLQDTVDEAQRRCEQLRNDHQQVVDELKNERAARERIETVLNLAISEGTNATQSAADAQAKTEQLELTLVDVKRQLEDKVRDAEALPSLRSQLEQVNALLADALGQKNTTQAELSKVKSQLDDLQMNHAILESQLKKVKQEYSRKQGAYKKDTDLLVKAYAQCDGFQDKLAARDSTIADLQRDLAEQRVSNTKLKAKRDKAVHEYNRLAESRRQARAVQRAGQEELNKILVDLDDAARLHYTGTPVYELLSAFKVLHTTPRADLNSEVA